jgi:CrcB protein
MWQRLVLVAFAGALGTLARYGLSGFVQRMAGGPFPFGTLAVNMIGCFLFGVIWTLADERLVISQDSRVVMLGGFMGAFTTFSTFIFDTGHFARQSEWMMATGNIVIQIVVGMVFLFLGITMGRIL